MQFLSAFFWSIFGFFRWKNNNFSIEKNVFGPIFYAMCDHCRPTKYKHGIVKFMKFMQHVDMLKCAIK